MERADVLQPPKNKGHRSVVSIPDAWYPGCRSEELAEGPVARTLLGTPLAIYRDGDGAAGALLDRCPHRNVALSGGAVDERGWLTCPYHGWRFDRTGGCRDVPGLPPPSDTEVQERAVPSHAVHEQDGFVWVWGRPDAPPKGRPVRIPHVDDPSYLVIQREYLFEASLHAALENALDVPHTAFVHRGDFRGGPRQPVTAIRRRIENGIEVEYQGEPPLAGPSHDEEGRPIVQQHWDRFFLPSVAQVEYLTGGERHLVTTFPHAPIDDYRTRGYLVTCWRLPGVEPESVRPALEKYLDDLLAQDVAILARQTENIRRFGGETYRSTDLDLMGPEIWRMLRQAERGLDPSAADIACTVELTV
ncbi:MAG: aromatic ring-hydroxylating dioxygenase subunit alpha [Myxococcota bacterium]|nr:aromatic ring-hydroxylating dioxygenase subunit alpha [Myxococcota bacterium]